MIHKYQSHGFNIVLDVDSGSVHVMDNIAYKIVDLCDAYFSEHPEDLPPVISDEELAAEELKGTGALDSDELDGVIIPPLLYDEVYQKADDYSDRELEEALYEILILARRGQLFTRDIYRAYLNEIEDRKTVVKALCLNIAHDCNLACKYCFAQEGEYNKERGLMSLEVAKGSLDFLVANSGNRINLEVDFFGGEPLLNWEVVKATVAYGRELEKKLEGKKKFRFTLTTNASLLTQVIMDFLNEEMANVVLSIDGRKEVHDNMRPYRNGGGSYDAVLPKVLEMAKSRGDKSWYARGTYTRFSKDFSKDVLHMADLGLDQISVEPVVAPPDCDYALREEDIPELLAEYDKLASAMLERIKSNKGFNFFHFMIDLEGGPCVAKRLSGCGSGTEYLSVTPWGDIYPCHQFVGNDDFLMGNVMDEVPIKRTDIQSEFKSCNVYSKSDCSNCFARYFCSGGCAANSYYYGSGIKGNYKIGCELQKKRVECAIMLHIAKFY